MNEFTRVVVVRLLNQINILLKADETHLFADCCHPRKSQRMLCLDVALIVHTIDFISSNINLVNNFSTLFESF